MTNLLVNPRIGLLFLVTGMNETLRINGTARITDDARLLAPSAVNNRPPKVGLVVKIEEALLHCAKALVRSALWDASRHIERAILPTYAQMLLDHVKGLTQAADAGYGRARALLVRRFRNSIICCVIPGRGPLISGLPEISTISAQVGNSRLGWAESPESSNQ
jgi:hypothetical protein